MPSVMEILEHAGLKKETADKIEKWMDEHAGDLWEDQGELVEMLEAEGLTEVAAEATADAAIAAMLA